MSMLTNLKEALTILEDCDGKYEELTSLVSQCDRKIDYWLHTIELETVPVTEAYKIIKEIKKQRITRRAYKNDLEILKVFRDNESKMCNSSNRKILLHQLCKTDNKHQNAKYSYDAYTEEELVELFK